MMRKQNMVGWIKRRRCASTVRVVDATLRVFIHPTKTFC